jgi:hypothetical protein
VVRLLALGLELGQGGAVHVGCSVRLSVSDRTRRGRSRERP